MYYFFNLQLDYIQHNVKSQHVCWKIQCGNMWPYCIVCICLHYNDNDDNRHHHDHPLDLAWMGRLFLSPPTSWKRCSRRTMHCSVHCALSTVLQNVHCVSQNVVQMIFSHVTCTDLHFRGRRQKNISDNCHGFWFTIIRRKKMSEFSIPASAYMRSCWKTIATLTILLIAWSCFVIWLFAIPFAHKSRERPQDDPRVHQGPPKVTLGPARSLGNPDGGATRWSSRPLCNSVKYRRFKVKSCSGRLSWPGALIPCLPRSSTTNPPNSAHAAQCSSSYCRLVTQIMKSLKQMCLHR